MWGQSGLEESGLSKLLVLCEGFLEGQRLESEALLVTGHDEEIALACSKQAKRRTPTNPEGGVGQSTASLRQIHRDEPVLEGTVSNRQCIKCNYGSAGNRVQLGYHTTLSHAKLCNAHVKG